MKLYVEANKITLSSSNDNIKTINEVVDDIIIQLRQQLLHGSNSSFLVSGYRGAGKTTLINKLIKNLEKENIVFVRLNFAKYEEMSIVLRRLIRELYLSLKDSGKLIEIKDKELVEQIELLYDHTFFEISSYSSLMKIKERNFEFNSSLNINDVIKKMLPIIAILISSLNIKFDFLAQIKDSLDILALLTSLIWFVVSNVDFKSIFLKKSSDKEENIRKSLYDDEIAEYYLKKILKGLEHQGMKIVFVFDELDKIDNSSDMINLISDLKPLFLSNLASFIIISGQKLYYKLLSSTLYDDSLMSSIFSRSIHVPLANDFELEEVFRTYLKDESMINNQNVKDYLSSRILNSNRTYRRFINLIQQDIVWNENEAYIKIGEDKSRTLVTDARILRILNDVIEKNIDVMEYEDGVRDFLTYQLYIWIKKMKLKGSTYFSLSEIFNFSEDLSSEYPLWYEIELNDLCVALAEKLVEDSLLESEEIEENKEIQYRWTNQASIDISSIQNDVANSKMKYLEEMINIEKYSKDIIIELGLENKHNIGLKSMITLLVENNIINERWLSQNSMRLYDLSNKVRHGQNFTVDEVEELIKSRTQVSFLRQELFEGYSFSVVNRILSEKGYSLTRDSLVRDNANHIAFDIIAKHSARPDILFEVISRTLNSSVDRNRIRNYIDNLLNYNKSTNKNNKLIVIQFLRIGSKTMNSDYITRMFKEQIYSYNNDLSNQIFILDIREGNFFNSSEILSFLENLSI